MLKSFYGDTRCSADITRGKGLITKPADANITLIMVGDK